jgi:hypothetical protein
MTTQATSLSPARVSEKTEETQLSQDQLADRPILLFAYILAS